MTTDTTKSGDKTHILLVEDDHDIALILREVLEDSGFRVSHAETGAAAKAAVDAGGVDLTLLDLTLPDTDGLVLCAHLKSRTDAPVIICSATHDKRDVILSFKLGADDFVPKPFDIEELVARIDASLRRAALSGAAAQPERVIKESLPAVAPRVVPAGRSPIRATAAPVMPTCSPAPADRTVGTTASAAGTGTHERIGTLEMDHIRRRVTVGDHAVALSSAQYRILATLVSRPDAVFKREELAVCVWGLQEGGGSIDAHIQRLRLKLSTGPVTPPSIVTVRGFGYRLVSSPI